MDERPIDSQKEFWRKVIGYKATLRPSGEGFLAEHLKPLFLGEPIPEVKPIGTMPNPDGIAVPIYPTHTSPHRDHS